MTDITLVPDALQSEIQVLPMGVSICGTCVNSKKLQGHCNHDQQLTPTHARSVIILEICSAVNSVCTITKGNANLPVFLRIGSAYTLNFSKSVLLSLILLVSCISLEKLIIRDTQLLCCKALLRSDWVASSIRFKFREHTEKAWPNLQATTLAHSSITSMLVDWKTPSYCKWDATKDVTDQVFLQLSTLTGHAESSDRDHGIVCMSVDHTGQTSHLFYLIDCPAGYCNTHSIAYASFASFKLCRPDENGKCYIKSHSEACSIITANMITFVTFAHAACNLAQNNAKPFLR